MKLRPCCKGWLPRPPLGACHPPMIAGTALAARPCPPPTPSTGPAGSSVEHPAAASPAFSSHSAAQETLTCLQSPFQSETALSSSVSPHITPFWFQTTHPPHKTILQNRTIIFMSCFYLVSCWCDTMYFRSALEILLCQKGKNKICVSFPWSGILSVVSNPHSGPSAASGQAFLEKLGRPLSHTRPEAPTKPGHQAACLSPIQT